MPPSKRLPCDDPEWIRRKTSIEEMYLFDRLSQKTIREKLEEDGFLVTKSELEAQLRFWNIRKNASKDAWRYVDYMLLKREQQGKDSVVYYNSRKVTRNTLKKERSRYQPGTLTKYITTQSPKTPEGMQLRIRTPTPAPMQSRWPHTLPWLRFQDSVLPTISYLTNQRFYVKLQAPDTKAQIELFSLRQRFGEVPSQTVFNLTVNIASMMPEETENEIPSCAQRMVHGTADQAFNEYFKLILYCLSNNLYTLNDWDVSSWDTVTHLIERSGLINRPLNLAKEKDDKVEVGN
ncbi:hypothetical protein CGCSCA5_v012619 [Colletotrichum siamense]|nr:hypothetical protein CGCSCA5_v012619 [Colletotrichum siamense]